jgi:hypothetical protein
VAVKRCGELCIQRAIVARLHKSLAGGNCLGAWFAQVTCVPTSKTSRLARHLVRSWMVRAGMSCDAVRVCIARLLKGWDPLP